MLTVFLKNAQLLSEKFGITPLLYGSLGLELRTGEALYADDIDILIPEVFLNARWEAFKTLLEADGYRLTDLHEHTFEKDGVYCSYASIENLHPFAGIHLSEIPSCEENGVRFLLLTLQQYRCVYAASSKDGYRAEVRGKKDAEKIAVIDRHLQK